MSTPSSKKRPGDAVLRHVHVRRAVGLAALDAGAVLRAERPRLPAEREGGVHRAAVVRPSPGRHCAVVNSMRVGSEQLASCVPLPRMGSSAASSTQPPRSRELTAPAPVGVAPIRAADIVVPHGRLAAGARDAVPVAPPHDAVTVAHPDDLGAVVGARGVQRGLLARHTVRVHVVARPWLARQAGLLRVLAAQPREKRLLARAEAAMVRLRRDLVARRGRPAAPAGRGSSDGVVIVVDVRRADLDAAVVAGADEVRRGGAVLAVAPQRALRLAVDPRAGVELEELLVAGGAQCCRLRLDADDARAKRRADIAAAPGRYQPGRTHQRRRRRASTERERVASGAAGSMSRARKPASRCSLAACTRGLRRGRGGRRCSAQAAEAAGRGDVVARLS